MTVTEIEEKRKDYMRLAVKYMPEKVFMDAWWSYLAQTESWYSSSPKSSPIRHSLRDLSSEHLYNIRNLIFQITGPKPSKNALLYIGVITNILELKSSSDEIEPEDLF